MPVLTSSNIHYGEKQKGQLELHKKSKLDRPYNIRLLWKSPVISFVWLNPLETCLWTSAAERVHVLKKTYVCQWFCSCSWLVYLPPPPCSRLSSIQFSGQLGRLEWTSSHQCTSSGRGCWSHFGDEPKTHPPLLKVIDFFSLLSAPKLFPLTYPPPTYLTDSIVRSREPLQHEQLEREHSHDDALEPGARTPLSELNCPSSRVRQVWPTWDPVSSLPYALLFSLLLVWSCCSKENYLANQQQVWRFVVPFTSLSKMYQNAILRHQTGMFWLSSSILICRESY